MEVNDIEDYISEGIKARSSVDAKKISEIGRKLSESFRNGGKLILMGNGGSAADSQHIAAEFVGRFEKEREPLPALALNTNTSSVTAISNDYSYEEVFARQVRAFSRKGDCVIGLSTSGNSKNVVRALGAAKEAGCYTVAMTGSKDGRAGEVADDVVKVDSNRTSIIQEVHIAIGHIWSKIVEDDLFGK